MELREQFKHIARYPTKIISNDIIGIMFRSSYRSVYTFPSTKVNEQLVGTDRRRYLPTNLKNAFYLELRNILYLFDFQKSI